MKEKVYQYNESYNMRSVVSTEECYWTRSDESICIMKLLNVIRNCFFFSFHYIWATCLKRNLFDKFMMESIRKYKKSNFLRRVSGLNVYKHKIFSFLYNKNIFWYIMCTSWNWKIHDFHLDTLKVILVIYIIKAITIFFSIFLK